jgi:hypothetical protein
MCIPGMVVCSERQILIKCEFICRMVEMRCFSVSTFEQQSIRGQYENLLQQGTLAQATIDFSDWVVPERDCVVSAAWTEERKNRNLCVPVTFAAVRCPWDSQPCRVHSRPPHAPEQPKSVALQQT